MLKVFREEDTICALATPSGGAIGIVRLSGPEAIAVANRVFRGRKPLADYAAGTLHYGHIYNKKGELLDDCVVSLWRTPHSYTGEDSVEFSCHGSAYILQQVLQALTDAGARQAEPGEYTRRAYINGKMDLSQAEAVADLIASTNRATHRMAMSQLRGHFSSELSRLRDQLLKLTSLLELELDFSDHEELEFADRSELQALATEIDERIGRLSRSFETGNALKRGVPVAIVGKTNVGKSTLLNRLVDDERAIVSDVHGTTRDVIEDTIEIGGVTFRFIDTAGLRQTDDVVESLGIERTYQKISEATIVLWVIDQEPTAEEAEEMKEKTSGKKLIIVRNKADLEEGQEERGRRKEEREMLSPFKSQDSSLFTLHSSLIFISAKFDQGLDALRHALLKAAAIPEITENDVIVTSLRHYEALQRAHADLVRVLDGMTLGLSGDLLAEDLRLVLHHLAEITGGEIVTDEVLGNIFSHFCVGK